MVGIIFQILFIIIIIIQGLGILSITERSVLKSSHMIVDLSPLCVFSFSSCIWKFYYCYYVHTHLGLLIFLIN